MISSSELRSTLQSDVQTLPTMHDLPSENPLEPGLPDEYHGLQPQLLAESLTLTDYDPTQIFQSFDLNLYYDPEHTGWYKRPDWFLVVGTTRLYRGVSSRSSYVIWDEVIPPAIVIEFLSPGTEGDDLGRFASKLPGASSKPGRPPGKFIVYEQILQVPHYIVFNETTGQLRYFRLVDGRYQEQVIASTLPSLWIPELKIGLGLWNGSYRHMSQRWLRWCDRDGNWLPTETERECRAKERERSAKEWERAEKERERSEKERERAEKEKLMTYLRSIGIDPNNLPS
jgi:Uma2 family endonuclease